jgi:hypothetical protein
MLRQRSLNLILGSHPAYDTSQGSGARRHAPSHRGSGAPKHYPRAQRCQPLFRQGHARGMMQEDKLLHSRGSRAPKPARQPIEPASFATKKSPESAPGGGWSKPTQPFTQSVRTEQPNDAQGFFCSMTLHGPQTLAHVDCRCIHQTTMYSTYLGI